MSNRGPILLIGAGGHARSCIDVLEAAGWTIAGLVGTAAEVGTTVLGYSVVGTDEDLPRLRQLSARALVSIGQIDSASLRIAAVERAGAAGYELPVVVSPRAWISRHARVGAGSIVMHDAIVNAGATIGCNCIVNTGALVEHDAQVGDYCHLSTRSVTNGSVTIGNRCFIGSAAVLKHGIRIGEDCFVGMGQSVTAALAAGTRQTQGSRN